MSIADRLFDPGPEEVPVSLSRDRKRTIRNRDLLDRGIHPATRRPIIVFSEERGAWTCGDCAHHVAKRYAKTYHKCLKAGITGGPGTDVRVSWPACVMFKSGQSER